MTTKGSPNLDCMPESELYAFAADTRGVSPRRVAAQLFGTQTRASVRAVRDLRNYAWNKITAMQCRLRGDIERATYYEAICDRIYDGLPAFARW